MWLFDWINSEMVKIIDLDVLFLAMISTGFEFLQTLRVEAFAKISKD